MTPEIQNAIEHVYNAGFMVGAVVGLIIGFVIGAMTIYFRQPKTEDSP